MLFEFKVHGIFIMLSIFIKYPTWVAMGCILEGVESGMSHGMNILNIFCNGKTKITGTENG